MESSDQATLHVSTDVPQMSNMDGDDQSAAMSNLSPASDLQDPILSPTLLTSHPLPAKPVSVTPNNISNTIQSPTSTSLLPKPRIIGGFEVDDDDEPEDEEEVQDGKDEADVYDPSVSLDIDSPAPVDASSDQPNLLDRNSQSPDQENGITPVPVQATGSPTDADISPSTTVPLSASVDPNVAQVATPSYTAPDFSAPTSTPRPRVNGAVAAGLPKSRLAHDVVGILEDRIKDDPRGDIDAYLELIDEFKSRNKQEDVRRVFEEYLKVFPFAVRVPV
jgi:cleavage stimulation factor subunit 3